MKIELRWVIVYVSITFALTLSNVGTWFIESSLLWLLAYIPWMISFSYTIAVERTLNKNLTKG